MLMNISGGNEKYLEENLSVSLVHHTSHMEWRGGRFPASAADVGDCLNYGTTFIWMC
jgi:hypothetical protein